MTRGVPIALIGLLRQEAYSQRCYPVAPEVFGADDAGYGEVRRPEVAPGDEAPARRGAANCPEDAISLDE